MDNILNINRIIVLRDDDSVKWENSSLILEKGEIGIGRLQREDKIIPIVKLGNGSDKWVDLPQIEKVMLEDIMFTNDFGKYKISNGNTIVPGNNLTLSEWIVNAFYEEQNPEIEYPELNFEGTIYTDYGTREIGNSIEKIDWNVSLTDGSYQYGSYNSDGTIAPDNGTNVSIEVINVKDRPNGEILNELTKGEIQLSESIDLNSIDNALSLTLEVTVGPSNRTPINNVGKKVSDLKVSGFQQELNIIYDTSFYREGCFYGSVNTLITVDDINSNLIRGLVGRLGDNYRAEVLSLNSQIGDYAIIIASHKNEIKSIYNKTIGMEMISNFNKKKIEVGGADSSADSIGKYPEDYFVYYYIPAVPYEKDTEWIITLGKEE